MNKRLGAIAVAVAAAAAAAGLFADPSKSAATYVAGGYCKVPFCIVALTGTGPAPTSVMMHAGGVLEFDNTDSATHTVVFTNGLCSLTLTPGDSGGPGFVRVGERNPVCHQNFATYVGSYAYTVDRKFPGTAVTTPLRRVVTLTARTHSIRRGTRVTLHECGCEPLDSSPSLLPAWWSGSSLWVEPQLPRPVLP